jgi:hypothetical protein
MTCQNHHRTATTTHQPPMADAEIDPCLIDDEFDDFLDRELPALRETLADFRSY